MGVRRGQRVVAAALAAVLVAGCGGGDGTKSQVNQAVGDTGRTASPVATDARTASASPTPSASPSPTRTPPPAPQAISIVAKGYGQNGRSVGFSFIVENSNQGMSVTNSNYQVAAYDSAGSVLKADSGYIEVILPGQRLGVSGSIFLPEGATISRLDTQVKPGTFKAAEAQATFTAENIMYRPDRFAPKVTGVIKSPFPKDAKAIYVGAIPYDAQGNIIGGGFTFLDFVPANGQAAVEILVTTSSPPAKVDLFPAVTALSSFD